VKDVEASPDGLGLTDPHIIVEAKYREGAMGSQVLRSFKAALRPRHKGLYVSTGGFAKEARYEADRANNQVSLIDSDELVNLIIHYYDNFCCLATPFMVLNLIKNRYRSGPKGLRADIGSLKRFRVNRYWVS
jgi:hypothetical protein